GSGSYDSIEGLWTIGSMINEGTEELEITVTVNNSGSYDSTAIISGNEEDPEPSNNSSIVTVTPIVSRFAIAGKSSLVNAYNNGVSFPDQIQMMKDIKASMYRIGLVPSADGTLNSFRYDV